MPDLILSKLASYAKIGTVDNLLEAVPDWNFAGKYAQEVLLLLQDADEEHRLSSQSQRAKTRELNRKHKMEDLEEGGIGFFGASIPSASSAVLPNLVHTRMIHPIIVIHTLPPMRPQSSHSQFQPVFTSHPFVCSEILDSLMSNC
jgi:hypothetical protein